MLAPVLDHNTKLTGDELRDFVNQRLFPYLHGFKPRASSADKIGARNTDEARVLREAGTPERLIGPSDDD